jgi:hypothetical protein
MNITFLDPTKVASYSGSDLQFYPNMRFNHNTITFTLDENCNEDKKEKVYLALNRLEEETNNSILFTKIESINDADMTITCNETEKHSNDTKKEYFIAGEGGATSVIKTDVFHIIEKGVVLLYYSEEKKCIDYNIELHEILHVFGFKHSENTFSIMYETTQCGQIFTNDIINELVRLYSMKPLPDIYIMNLTADKKGTFLNFDIEVRNQGLIVAKDVKVIVSAQDKKIKAFDLEDISYGEGKIMMIENLRLPLLTNTDRIKFTLETISEELSLDNNEIILGAVESD